MTTPKRSSRTAQRGVSLLFALIALVILTFGAVALTRSVDTGTLIMGNLAFRQDAVAASSSGAEEAMKWLQDNIGGTKLNSHVDDHGYRANSTDTLDVTGGRTAADRTVIDWDGKCMGAPAATVCLVPYKASDVNENKVQWLITRLCQSTDAAPASPNKCVRPANSGTGASNDRGELGPGGRPTGVQASPYYRIIVRVDGPRNTVSYTESLVHF
jgi:type IV pilus assembly protein PilX